MTEPRIITYNLPGYGLIRSRLFPYAETLYGFLERSGHIRRLEKTAHLGVLRHVFPGAHHTRYEYTIAQLAIISELCKLKDRSLPAPLTSTRDDFGRLPRLECDPSGGEIIQCLILLSNVGHLPQTFGSQRTFLHFLRANKHVRKAFRLGLARGDRQAFDAVLRAFEVYQLHYFIALFSLERYRRTAGGNQIVDFCRALIGSYRGTTTSDSLELLWNLYRSVRRLTYLSLDSLYTPVPFSLDLTSIFASLDHYLDDVFTQDSEFQDALRGFEAVMQESIYLSPSALLQLSRSSECSLRKLEKKGAWSRPSIRRMNVLLAPGSPGQDVFIASDAGESRDWDDRHRVAITFRIDPIQAPKVLTDTVECERIMATRVGRRSVRFGVEWDPAFTRLGFAAALKQGVGGSGSLPVALAIIYQLLAFETDLHQRIPNADLSDVNDRKKNARAILEFLLRSLFGIEYRYRIRMRAVGLQLPIAVCAGSTKASRVIEQYARVAGKSDAFDVDALVEIEVLANVLAEISYQGLLIAFAGNTEVIDAKNGNPIAEFDGLVFLLRGAPPSPCAVVVESKNQQHGHTAARKQIARALADLDIGEARYTITEAPKYGAYATIAPKLEVATPLAGGDIEPPPTD